jgi:HSP20 family molecular chaperone IbpA
MTSNDKDFFGIRVSPVDLLATVLNDALANQAGAAKSAAKSKVRDFDPQAHLDNIFAAGQEFFGGFNTPGTPEQKAGVVEFTPAVDVLESETGVTYLVGAPGVRQDEVVVELEDTKLTISISSGNIILADQPTHNWKGGHWSQSFNIPTGDAESSKKIDEENISATVENGLITVRVSYKAPKVTQIKVG